MVDTTVTCSTETLANGDATLTVTPGAIGWQKGAYTIRLEFSQTVNSIVISDSLDVNVSMNVGVCGISYNTPTNGTINADKPEYVEKNKTATFGVTPAAGYVLDTTNTTATKCTISFDGNNATGDVSVNVAFTLADTTFPVISDVTGIPQTPQKTDANISFTVTDENNNVKTVTIKKDNGAAATLTSANDVYSYAVSENGDYCITATDSQNNITTKNFTVANIDKTKPVVNIDSHGYIAGAWSKDNITLNVSNSASNLGTTKVEVSADGTNYTPIINGEYVINTDSNKTYSFKETSQSGVVSDIVTFNAKLDKTLPIITGASNSSSYFIGRIIKSTDDTGEIVEATYKNGTDILSLTKR